MTLKIAILSPLEPPERPRLTLWMVKPSELFIFKGEDEDDPGKLRLRTEDGFVFLSGPCRTAVNIHPFLDKEVVRYVGILSVRKDVP